ncbi:ABC transporter permease [Halobacteriales archaeon QS_1_68_17]|nr:MAG: ABC transporter permease [Halobacteriales archaeon QS_1_68_17]
MSADPSERRAVISSRWSYVLRRLVLAVPVVVLAASLTFVAVRLGPTDPVGAIIGPTGDPGRYHEVAVQLGIERRVDGRYVAVPLWEQYVEFMTDLFTLQLGQSWVISPETSVYAVIASRAPQTLWLAFWSALVAVGIGVPLGFYAGLHPNTPADYVASVGGIVWRAMPNFWLAIVVVTLLSQSGRLVGIDWAALLVPTDVVTSPSLTHLHRPERLAAAIKGILPAALVLGSASMGNEMRIARTAVLETRTERYVEAARAKGVPRELVVWKHVFRNALVPLVPVVTGEFFLLVGGAVLVETVFAINGIGRLFFEAAVQGDLPLVGSLLFLFALLTIGVNILQDVLYTLIDPRVGYER